MLEDPAGTNAKGFMNVLIQAVEVKSASKAQLLANI